MGSNPIARSKSLSDLYDKGGRSERRLSAECPRNVFPACSGEHQLVLQGASDAGSKSSECPASHGTPRENWARERHTAPARSSSHLCPDKRPAHPSNCLIAQLNANWRVVDDPLQWILQRRNGTPREKSTGWQGRSFCRTREGLLRCIREYCCLPDQGGSRCVHEYRGVDAAALQHVRALPEWHIDWEPLSAVELGHDAPFLAFAADEMVQ